MSAVSPRDRDEGGAHLPLGKKKEINEIYSGEESWPAQFTSNWLFYLEAGNDYNNTNHMIQQRRLLSKRPGFLKIPKVT